MPIRVLDFDVAMSESEPRQNQHVATTIVAKPQEGIDDLARNDRIGTDLGVVINPGEPAKQRVERPRGEILPETKAPRSPHSEHHVVALARLSIQEGDESR